MNRLPTPFLLLTATAAALTMILPPNVLDVCQSFPNRHFVAFNAATEYTLNIVIVALVLTVAGSHRSVRSLQALGCSITSSFTLIVLVVALKELLRDSNCSRHANSVSGHVAFHLFANVLSCLDSCTRLWRAC